MSETLAKNKPRHIIVNILFGLIGLAAVLGVLLCFLKGMDWFFSVAIRPVTGKLVYGWMGYAQDSPRGMALRFFLAILSKVMILLVGLIYVVGLVRTYFSPEHTRRILAGKHEFVGNILASLLGVVTPFCTCSAISLFIGFIEAGIPLGVTLSFLIAAPMINEIALGLLFQDWGSKIALMYAGFGLLIAIISGWILGRLNPRDLVEDWVYEIQMGNVVDNSMDLTIKERFQYAWENLRDVMGRIWPAVTIGIAVAAVIYGGVPQDAFANILGGNHWWSVPLATAIGVPLYANAGSAVPMMTVLLQKGAALGTALAFMMGIVGLSLPEIIILRKVLKPKMITIFVAIVSAGIMTVGYIFNYTVG